MPIRRAFLASLAVTVALVVDAPAAGASPVPASGIPTGAAAAGVALPGGGNAIGPCATSATDGQDSTGGVPNHVCLGDGGLSFVGPAIGAISSNIGPTIIGPSVVGTSIVSAGAVAVGY
jgi:hypothetical protein